MRYIKLSFKYLLKNFLFLFVLSLIPAIFMGSLLSPFKFLEFINNYANLTITNFGSIFYSIIDISWLKLLFYILSLIFLAICLSVIVGAIENHFRTGKKNYFNFKYYINNNIMSICLNVFVFIVINFLISFLSGTLIYLFHILFTGLNSTPNIACIILSLIIFTLYFLVIIMVSMVLMINIPNMIYNGYNFKQATASSINLVSKNYLNLLIAFALPFVAIIPLIAIFNFSNIAIHIVNVIGLIFTIIYYSSLTLTTYFDLANLSRYDERKYYNIK